MTFQFANPWILLFLLAVPPLVLLWKFAEKRTESSIRFSEKGLIEGIRPTFKIRLSGGLIYLRAIVLALIVIAAARPQSAIEKTRVYVEGIDIVLAVDVSGSMRAMDFEIDGEKSDRLQVVKKAVTEFIGNRPNDRIGLVAFGSYAYTVCPLTLDHEWLDKNIERVQIGMVKDGTAIGSAIMGALNRLKDTEAKEKIIILLTDGRNNAGRVSPMVAAEAARTLGVRIYTIGAGTKGLAPYPVRDSFGNMVLRPVEIELDEELLEQIAEATGGLYFRATDTRQLEKIYAEIDKLETTPMEETGYNIYEELFGFALFPALMLLLLEIFLTNTVLRRIP